MRISFDLDETLICYGADGPFEPRPALWRRLALAALGYSEEPLRLGSRQLLADLRRAGWEVAIYTTSYRSPAKIRWWLWAHGLQAGLVINQDRHEQAAALRGGANLAPSKQPSWFGIDLHVDDLPGVGEEGRRCGFSVTVIDPADSQWTERVRAAAEAISRQPR